MVSRLGIGLGDETIYRELENIGIDLESLDDLIVGKDGLYTILPNGTVSKVVVYISFRDNKQIHDIGYPKFHIFSCTTLEQMKREGRYHKYKISRRTDGKFIMWSGSRRSATKKPVELDLCKNCERMLNRPQYRGRFNNPKKSKSFIRDFLNSSVHSDIRSNTLEYDYDTIPNFYPADWELIAKKRKEQHGYTCEICGWKAKAIDEQKFIHAHHLNWKKYDNSSANLKILCMRCHADEPGHDHMKKLPGYRTFLNKS